MYKDKRSVGRPPFPIRHKKNRHGIVLKNDCTSISYCIIRLAELAGISTKRMSDILCMGLLSDPEFDKILGAGAFMKAIKRMK